MEMIYKERTGYMIATKDKVTRCKNCRWYADEVVKYRNENGEVTGSYCRQWRAYTAENGYCYKGKKSHE